MNPETTNRTFEDTNISEKKITDRGMTSLGTPVTSGVYELYTATRTVEHILASSKPIVDCYVNYNFASVATQYVFPGNSPILNPITGTMYSSANYSISGSGGSLLITQTFSTLDPADADWNMFDVVYSSKITQDTVVGF